MRSIELQKRNKGIRPLWPPHEVIEEPIRDELLSPEHLYLHAEELAHTHNVATKPRMGRPLLPRLLQNGQAILRAYKVIDAAVRERLIITPAAEWIIDNYYVTDEQIRGVRVDLPRSYYLQLPKLISGELAGYPRVYALALEYVAHSDSRFDPDLLVGFIQAYQRVQPLSNGELWAVPIALRLGLVENLRRLAVWVVEWQKSRQDVADLADGFLSEDTVPDTEGVIRQIGREALPQTFVVHLIQRLRETPVASPIFSRLLDYLALEGTKPDELISLEHARQAAANVSVSNIITSMRAISAYDWELFFNQVSLVETTLCTNPLYAASDFATRDRLRHCVEELAHSSPYSEIDIAQRVIEKTQKAGSEQLSQAQQSFDGLLNLPRECDPGFYLLDKGRRTLEGELRYKAPLTRWLRRAFLAFATPGYLGTLALATALVLALALWLDARQGATRLELVLLGIFALIPASDLAIALVNRFVMGVVPPLPLPKLELKDGIPESLRTVVAIPTLLISQKQIEEQIERLEAHYFANPDDALRFALLGDWVDAPSETLSNDAALLQIALEGIQHLNNEHGLLPAGEERFLLFQRKREWNRQQGCWMGWERKRGKLSDFNRLLRGNTDTRFIPLDATPPKAPSGVRFVITLDADTELPRGIAARLVGTLAHPLNRPHLDPVSKRVLEGYGILQPRITPSLPEPSEDTAYRRIFSGPAGIDPYASATSDIYQDLFAEGNYTGKGIYDVDAFSQSLEGRVPENTLLSHDLFEGLFARTALVSDIELVEDFPTSYEANIARQHRWVRGDWQLLPWLLTRRAPIPVMGRWKIIDNLRRSLSAPAAFITLLAAWVLPLTSPCIWTGLVIATIIIPPMIPVLTSLPPRRPGISRRVYLGRIARDFVMAASKLGLAITLLAHQSWLMLDAIGRTLLRLVRGKGLLQWRTAAQTVVQTDQGLLGFYQRMFGAPLLSILAGSAVLLEHARGWEMAVPFLVAWMVSPAVARWISLPIPAVLPKTLSAPERQMLRLIARRTWHFFEDFVGPGDHFLPPDNFQEDPKPVVAHRTSPTNIGLYLLSVISAHDFGWIGLAETLERLVATLNTLGRMEKFKGHLFNWYDTRDLRVLEPRYISSVDSGNLAGHLIALQQSLLEFAQTPLQNPALEGLKDTLALVVESTQSAQDRVGGTVTKKQLLQALTELSNLFETPVPIPKWAEWLEHAEKWADTALDISGILQVEGVVDAKSELLDWSRALLDNIRSHRRDLALVAAEHALDIRSLSKQIESILEAMEFDFLYDRSRKLFSIGYDVRGHRLDANCYDLLASESRLTSFVAIARSEVPTGHWFRLGRSLTPVERSSALVSWSGSMFEYLMPVLVMHSPNGSLLEQTYHQVVARQISYGRERGVPWGVSESAHYTRDRELTYQYSAFGLPGLGLKRGLAEELVISPYSTALGAMIDPVAATHNFSRLMGLGACNRYGFYDALDYTADRLPDGVDFALVRNHMAHHQGMSVVALANVLLGNEMQRRFHQDIRIRATSTLLHERMPPDVTVARVPAVELYAAIHVREMVPTVSRQFSGKQAIPQTHLLSNGRYSVMLSTAGSGYSRWKGLAVTRWREDRTSDDWGSYIYLRDVRSGQLWSATRQPTALEPSTYEAQFYEERARFFRRDGDIASTLQILISPEDDAEIRRVALRNYGEFAKEIELISYAEVVLAPPAADLAHPAFSKLFVHTEYVPELGALLATRRPRSSEDTQVWAAHVISSEPTVPATLHFQTDRSRFLGRGQGVHAPASLVDNRTFIGTAGDVLDPIFSLRIRVRLEPGEVARIGFTTLVASSREEALILADKYRNPAAFERALTLAWTDARVELRHLGIEPAEAALFQELTGHVLFANRSLRASPEVIGRDRLGQTALWKYGISGDLPILIVRIAELGQRELVRQIMRAYQYWRRKRLAVDLIILDEEPASYASALQTELRDLLRVSQPPAAPDGLPGDVFVLQAAALSSEERGHLQSVARVLLSSASGTLSQQLSRIRPAKLTHLPRFSRPLPAPTPEPVRLPELRFYNGLGGFSPDGKEYVIGLSEGQSTPSPWVNVVANPGFGFIVSESGGGYTWALNSRENKLTPWSNDPVSDSPGEAFYLRDEESGELWNPTARPIRQDSGIYIAHHGQGYSCFERSYRGIKSELLQLVPLQDPIKISRLKLENHSSKPRRLSVTAYTEWVLGVARETTAPYTVTEQDPSSKALLAWNNWSQEFADHVAFAQLTGAQQWTCDRNEFIGQGGTLQQPVALEPGTRLLAQAGAGLDPCAVLQTTLEIPPGGQLEVVFLLGQGVNRLEAQQLITRYREVDVEATLSEVKHFWDDTLGRVQVETPDRALDLLLNRWLLYQTLSSRVWARSGFYQAGGAYGFRDQLQDLMALVGVRPDLAKEQLLRAAARQFVEGDVQHWWHPPSGRGVRTHISDDLLWLPYTLTHYLEVTSDRSILDEMLPFLEGIPIPEGQEDAYFGPGVSPQHGTLYEHCARTLDRSLAVGVHGLPLMGSGDWNDGLNRVGQHGKGESVWLGWFLHSNLWEWAKIADSRGEKQRAKSWRAHLRKLKHALEHNAWDGDWYRRAFFDDGTPLGSAQSEECRIDAIAQSWATISGAAEPERAQKAMNAVEQHLVRPGDGLVMLFTPPFEHTAQDPGYIKGYPPGVRENGGQYTHAAVWSAIAFAALGDGDKAGELLSLLNPITQAATRSGVHRYKVEPYVMAADVYSVPPHVGRGGWTWYTGSAGWMYRAGLEWLLGFRERSGRLYLDPCIPKIWREYTLRFNYHSTSYIIRVENPKGVCHGVVGLDLDGVALTPSLGVELRDDGISHQVLLLLG